MRKLFKNAFLILPPDQVSGIGFLCSQEGVIDRVVVQSTATDFDPLLAQELDSSDEVIDCRGEYLAPGFIDLHCHGAIGRDTMEASVEAFDRILEYHATRGTTIAVLTTVAASWEEMECVLTNAQNYGKSALGSRFGGIHLEGPYFSPLRRGAHREEMLRSPSQSETQRLLSYVPIISRMTLAPELSGVLELTTALVQKGVRVSAGHSDATQEEADAGFEAGISQVTHLYNCMSSLQSRGGRRFTGLAEAALTTSGILCEVIADGRHLSATLLRLAWMAKGWKEIVIVSDATAGAGLPEGASFELGGMPCKIEHGSAWTDGGEGELRLAGSTIGMIDGVRVMVEEAMVPLNEAVAMATIVPARALGLHGTRGSLACGIKCDLVRFSAQWQVGGVWSAAERIA